MKYCFAFILLLSGLRPLAAQRDTVLPTVTIRTARFERTGYAIRPADSLPGLATVALAERLAWQSALEVRANAPGTLATLSARGAGAGHTPVYWLGLNLQSPMNGVVDAALLPVWPGDRLELRLGGQSAALSAGAMGGSVLLEPRWKRDGAAGWGAQLGGSAGSFGAYASQGALTYGSDRLHSAVRAAWQRADNDFAFRNTTQIGAPRVRQVQNFYEKFDLQQFNEVKTGAAGGVVRTAFWHQRAFREIPPAMTQAPVESWQRDRATRALATWQPRAGDRVVWQHRLAWLDEQIAFFLPAALEESRSQTALAGSDLTVQLGRQWVGKAGWQAQRQAARADGYRDSLATFVQWRAAAFAMLEHARGRWRWSTLVRQEWAERQGTPFTWSVGVQADAGRAGAGRLHVSRNFNLPTFNDRYWRAWGNADLRPETGYSADVGWSVQPAPDAPVLSATVFQLLIDDWILWQPGADGFFRPDNLRRVWSRGLEAAARITRRRGNWRCEASAQYQWTRATTVAIYAGETAALDRQLPYTAAHRGGLTLHAASGAFAGAYLHQWTGARFTTTDNSAALPGFATGTVLAQYTFTTGRLSVALDGRIENCWNASYQWLAYRAMPGRSFRIGLSVEFR
jgi:vitamin B12 transporter